MFFSFQLRKDLYNKNSQSLLVNSAIATKNTEIIARNYINTLITDTNTIQTTIQSTVENKIDKTEIYTILDNYYANGGGGNGNTGGYNTSQILNLINDVIQKAISDINLTKEQSILEVTKLLLTVKNFADKSEINAINAEESKKAAELSATLSSTAAAESATSATTSSASAASAALLLEKTNFQARKAEESAERATFQARKAEESAETASYQAIKAEVSERNAETSATAAASSATAAAASERAAAALLASISETAASITIAIYNSTNLNNSLIEKIEYLFQFFYHSDSTTIMESYPNN
jgi:hypothetical protein